MISGNFCDLGWGVDWDFMISFANEGGDPVFGDAIRVWVRNIRLHLCPS